MRVLIDGHNALGALRVRAETHEAMRETLLRRVAAASPQATVFFDAPGSSAPGRRFGVQVRYCRDADAAILEAVREAEAPGRLVVVTDDREVAGRAAQLGAQVMNVAQFFGPPEATAPTGRRRPPPARPRFTPRDFGLPDEVDLSDPDLD
ncbi:MAG: NYN domain-containing protein [Planctomycetota bacterium]|jgi:hypothetical protein